MSNNHTQKYQILKERFGFEHFRAIQEDAIDRIVDKKSLLAILPTGSGKSLIYQLSTLMMPGTTIVISPLIALMQDQIANLKVNGIEANMISSANVAYENSDTLSKLLRGELKFLYVAPERFASEQFLEILQKVDINFFVIDEAHCVSEWGHEFRDDYRKLSLLPKSFPQTPIAAFTATATSFVERDIINTLSIPEENILKTSLKRENLLIRSQKRIGNGLKQTVEFLKYHINECGIIYCFTRKECENFSEMLNKNGFETLPYHAGFSSEIRDEVFRKFKSEEIKIIVATIAFGMGIDKNNIRFVVHTSMPKTLENYTQEIGRAGRDGLSADVLLLYSKSDEIGKKRLIDDLPHSSYKSNNYEKLTKMYQYCVSSQCRHKYIASYFGDDTNACKEVCDNCLGGEKELREITTESQKFLSAILRSEERFGQTHIIDILRGSKGKKIEQFGHHNLSVYGIGGDLSKEQWGVIADRLLDLEAMIVDGEYRTLKISPLGALILKGEKRVEIDSANLIINKTYNEYKSEITKSENFEAFRQERLRIAKEEKIAPYIIFSDKSLEEISRKLPISKEEFLSISGVGAAKLEKYGEIFIKLCKKLRESGERSKEQLSKTYLESLQLIEEGKSIDEIAELRELQENTIIMHLEKLFENGYILSEKKELLLKPLRERFPDEIKKWIEDGKKIENIETLKARIQGYLLLFER